MKILKDILAGFLIGIGGFAFLKVGGPIGALLFAFGIICVVKLQTPLYTGIAGTDEKFSRKMLILLGNIFGGMIAAGIMIFTLDNTVLDNAHTIMENKVNTLGFASFAKAIMCGAIVDISVFLAKRDNSVVPLLIGIPTFVMCGFNHSIADVFYICVGRAWQFGIWNVLLYYVIVVVGNYLGCNIRKVFTE